MYIHLYNTHNYNNNYVKQFRIMSKNNKHRNDASLK